MSLKFNATASPYDGLIQRCEVNVFGEDALGKISGSSTLLGLWTTRLNQAKQKIDIEVLGRDGLWENDDRNHEDMPTVYLNIVAGQREYTVDTDKQGNVIFGVRKVYLKDGSLYNALEPTDEVNDPDIYDEANTVGVATRYGKKGNVIILDRVPESNITSGLKVEVIRESVYFVTSDANKTAGYGPYDYLVADLACFEYSLSNTIANVGLTAPYVEQSKEKIKKFFAGDRAKDERTKITYKKINYI